MNSVALVGRLTKDPIINYTTGENATAITRFTLAVDRRFKRDDVTADFPSCVAFGKTGEFINNYFSKGQRIGIVGRLQTGKYVNKDGITVYTTDVVVENAEFVDSKRDSGDVGIKTDNSWMNVPEGINEELPFN